MSTCNKLLVILDIFASSEKNSKLTQFKAKITSTCVTFATFYFKPIGIFAVNIYWRRKSSWKQNHLDPRIIHNPPSIQYNSSSSRSLPTLLKYYIYGIRCQEKEISLDNFKCMITDNQNIEYEIAITRSVTTN